MSIAGFYWLKHKLLFAVFGTAFLAVFIFAVGHANAAVFDQPIDVATSIASSGGDNWYQLGTGFSGTLYSLSVRGVTYAAYIPNTQHVHLQEFNDASYGQLNQTFILSDSAHFADVVATMTFSGFAIPLDPTKYYRLLTWGDLRPFGSIILQGTDSIGVAMFNFGAPAHIIQLYTFYPYLVSNLKMPEPVLIVPGIMGTRLNRVLDGIEVWPNVNEMDNFLNGADAYLNVLKLDNLGAEFITNKMDSSTIIDKEFPFGIKNIFYENLINSLAQVGYTSGTTLFTVPYDWRLDIRDEIDKLDAKIQEAVLNSPTGKINIIAHSMGGLLVKEYLRQATSTVFIDKLILAGVPQLGTPLVFKTLNYGDSLNFKLGPLDILNSQRVKEISQNMPGVYQLLPSRQYIDLGVRYAYDFRADVPTLNPSLDYDQTKQFLVGNGRNATLLDQADMFHQALDNFSFNSTSTYYLVGCGRAATIGNFRIYDKGKYDIGLVNGDGTVPFVSTLASSSNSKSYFALYNQTSIDHTGLIRDARPIALMKNIINDNPDDFSSGISTSSASCAIPMPTLSETTIMFSTHSPVELHVYDGSGQHVGPNANGDIELEIPGSDYYRIEDNSFAIIPGNTASRVTIDALSGGTFDLKARIYAGNTISSTFTYLNVPLQNSSTFAQVNILGPYSFSSLSLDSNGDGAFDTVLSPTAVLGATSSNDILPPEIIMLEIPSEIALGTSLTFIFSATDDISGIAFLKGTLDGVPVEQNGTMTMSTVGQHIFRVEATDRVGNPLVREQQFNVYQTFGGRESHRPMYRTLE